MVDMYNCIPWSHFFHFHILPIKGIFLLSRNFDPFAHDIVIYLTVVRRLNGVG